ncbi:MAG: zinc ribbon domain-containing protein [Pseudomonadota bacterium]
MPIYEFICQECRNTFELLALKESDLVETKCPTCGSENFERVMSSVNVISGSPSGIKKPAVENRTCSSGTCSTITLPGHTK